MDTEVNYIEKVISDLETMRIRVGKFYLDYFKKNRGKFADDNIIVKKLTKFYNDKHNFISLRFKEFFTEILFLDILKKYHYNFLIDYKNPDTGKDVDFYIKLSDEENLLLETYTPNESKWFPHRTGFELSPVNRRKAKERAFKGPWDVGERWEREIAYKILNEAINKRNKFADGEYRKTILFNLSDFGPFRFEHFWDKFFEDGRGLARGKDEIKNKENLEKLKIIKDFYFGLIFLSISETVDGTDFVSFYYKLFKQTSRPLNKFLKRLLKERKPGIISYQLFRIKKRIKEYFEWQQLKKSLKKKRHLKHKTGQRIKGREIFIF
ncbi:hypothetical protein KAW96_04865 [candidate division WOR-3 bacterium]|nr:hypothetical protein [candidate division WOR-3 bacterium]